MKKIWTILSVFLGLGLIVSLVMGFTSNVSNVPSKSLFLYRLLTGFQYFIMYLPAITMTGYVVSCSVHFGRNPEGSSSRFSKAMGDRFKSVMITSLIIVAVLTLSTEVFGLLINQKKNSIINQPKLINEYIKVGNNLFKNGYYERAMGYADAALKLNPNAEQATDLKDRADVEINRAKTSNLRFKLYESVEEAVKVDRVEIDPQQIGEVYELYTKAKTAFDKKEWFNAHYYAELGVNLATPKDPNLEELKKLSTAAWNNLTEYHNLDKTADQKVFDKKYEGYLALVQKDDLKAYYIFRELYLSSREMQSDPDVTFYLEIAENRINERCFFIDETFELESFENANNVYFAYEYGDGSKDIVYFKGMTSVSSTGNSIQYLRDLTITSIDKNGAYYRIMRVPYAKVLPVSVKTLTPTTKSLMGIDDKINVIPYIMLKSVGRDKPNTELFPEYIYADGERANSPEYMLLSISYDDFLMLEDSISNPDVIPLISLFKLVYKAADYGFSAEVYGQVLMNRLLYPLFILIMFILLATFAWNCRIGLNQYFKFSWIIAFPIFILLAFILYKMFMFTFKLLNFVLLGSFGITSGLAAGIILYVILLIVMSIYFLARRSR